MKSGLVLATGAVRIAFALNAGAQVQTTTTTTAGLSNQVVKVESGEVLARNGANRDLELTINAICML
jgi:hypothetical protein